MSESPELHRDDLGVITLNEATGILELRWLPGSADMTDAEFKDSMLRYAQYAEQYRPQYLLVDVIDFAFTPGADVATWRDANVIPRYNAAGVQKMAFLLPEGSAVEGSPQPEPPGRFPTGYFDTRARVHAWFDE